MKVFLGGTCAGWKWRDELQPLLKCDYYNPGSCKIFECC